MTTKMKLIHKSRKYADEIIDKISEDHIRDVVLRCWQDAFAEGRIASERMEREFPRGQNEMGS
jgi:hypothetical protein